MTATAAHSNTEYVTTVTVPAERVMTNTPRPRVVSSLTLAATSTAVHVGLLFLNYTLIKWDHQELALNGETLLSEMVMQAVKLTGVPDPSPRWVDLDDLALVCVRLMLFDHAVVIEVADRHREPPNPSEDFRWLSKRWNFYPTQAGRVVWCELELPHFELTERGLPKRPASRAPRIQRSPPPHVDEELLRSVRKGLKNL